ncbi:MAG: 30S ribosomal protein S17 [Anaerolineaceae bacterium]|jgi:small subunit ribosomal protein S17|nr:30S ribosomal protein S17 [Anaerolineaceae bacterium]
MNERRRLTGVVTSNRMTKTVVVVISRTYRHPLYRKVVHTSHKVKAHDELGCHIGDEVTVVESAPFSREVCWVVESIVKREGKTLDLAEEAVQ